MRRLSAMLPLLSMMGSAHPLDAPGVGASGGTMPRQGRPGRRTETGYSPRSTDRRPPSRMPAPDAARNRALIEADRTKREARRARSTKNTPFSG